MESRQDWAILLFSGVAEVGRARGRWPLWRQATDKVKGMQMGGVRCGRKQETATLGLIVGEGDIKRDMGKEGYEEFI